MSVVLLESLADGTRVYGPYYKPSMARRLVNIIRPDGSQTSMAYARWMMAQHLGRWLTDDEAVDHIDENPLNDSLSNLQVLTPVENAKKYHRLRTVVETIACVCPQCERVFHLPARVVRTRKRVNKSGPFCRRSCAARWQHCHARGAVVAMRTHGTWNRYRSGCRCARCRSANAERARAQRQRRGSA